MISVASEKNISTAKKRDIAPFKVNGLISYEVVPRDFDTRVKLIYFSQFYRQYENGDIHVEHSEIHDFRSKIRS
jgi:hypothetical protein